MRPGMPLPSHERLDSIAVSGDGRHLAVGSSHRQGFWLYTINPPQVGLWTRPSCSSSPSHSPNPILYSYLSHTLTLIITLIPILSLIVPLSLTLTLILILTLLTLAHRLSSYRYRGSRCELLPRMQGRAREQLLKVRSGSSRLAHVLIEQRVREPSSSWLLGTDAQGFPTDGTEANVLLHMKALVFMIADSAVDISVGTSAPPVTEIVQTRVRKAKGKTKI